MSMNDPEIEQLTASIIDAGLLEADIGELEESLGQKLKQDLLQRNIDGELLPEWASGDYGLKDIARRFINSQLTAICRELSDPETGQLRPEYARFFSPNAAEAAAIAGIATAILKSFSVSLADLSISTIAVYVSAWLIKINVQNLCAENVADTSAH